MNIGARSRRRIATGLVIAVAAYALLVLYAGLEEVAQGLSAIDGETWVGLLLLTAVHFALRFLRWRFYLRVLGHDVPDGFNFLVYMSGFALTVTPGKIGETWRGLYLAERGVPVSDPIAAFVAERFTDLAAVLGLSLLGLGVYTGETWLLVLGGVVMVVGFAALQHPRLPMVIEAAGAGGRLERVSAGLGRMLRRSARLLSPGLLAAAVLVAALAWGAQGAALWLLLERGGFEVGLWPAIGVYAIAICAGALSFLPGGLGSTEVVLIALLVALGLGAEEAVVITIIVRIVTLWLAVLLGVMAAAWLEAAKWSRRLRDA